MYPHARISARAASFFQDLLIVQVHLANVGFGDLILFNSTVCFSGKGNLETMHFYAEIELLDRWTEVSSSGMSHFSLIKISEVAI